MTPLQKYPMGRSEEKAWLRLVHARGIGPQKAWRIYHHVKESGLDLADVFKTDVVIPGAIDISPALQKRLAESDPSAAEERFKYLQRNSLQLLYPGAAAYDMPHIPGLPPTLTFWGDLRLLNSRDVDVLMKSRDTSEGVLRSFLQSIARGKIAGKQWCFCPFSRLDWELAESLMKLGCGVILGLVSGISRRAMTLAHEVPAGRLVIFAPEPSLRSRGGHFACLETFYKLFTSFTHSIFILTVRKGGKTSRRIDWAKKMGCEITEFEPANGSREIGRCSDTPKRKDKIDLPRSEDPSEEDDNGFISCL